MDSMHNSPDKEMQKGILDGILKYYKYPENIITGSPHTIEIIKQVLHSVNRG
jgi:hypothetical protein